MEKDNIKYLGVIIDSRLNWKNHILTISKKISGCIGIMCKLRQFVNTNMLKNIYYSCIPRLLELETLCCIYSSFTRVRNIMLCIFVIYSS